MVNRFFQPSRSQYVSQFVEHQLPQDLMLAVLGQKQKQQDLAGANLIELGEFNQRALPEADANYVKDYVAQLEGFRDKFSGQDLTSPDFQREYMSILKKHKENVRSGPLAQISSAVAQHDEFLKRQKELKESKNPDDYNKYLENEYNTRYAEYTKVGGKGYAGDIKLGDESTLTGVNQIKEAKTLFDDINASGADASKMLSEGIYYKTGSEGVAHSTIQKRVIAMVDAYKDSPAGNQLTQEYNAMQFPGKVPSIALSNLTPDERSKYDAGLKKHISDFLVKAGGEFEYNKTTSNLAEAQNKKGDREREDKLLMAQQPVLEVSGIGDANMTPTWDQVFGSKDGKPGAFVQNQEAIKSAESNINLFKRVQSAISNGEPIKLSPSEQAIMKGIPGSEYLLQGKPIPNDLGIILSQKLKDYTDDNIVRLNEYKRTEHDFQNRIGLAADVAVNKTYEGLKPSQVYQKYDELDNSFIGQTYKNTLNGLSDPRQKQGYLNNALELVRNNIKKGNDDPKILKQHLETLLTLKQHIEVEKDVSDILSPKKSKPKTKNIFGKDVPGLLDLYDATKEDKIIEAKKQLMIDVFNNHNQITPTATLLSDKPEYIRYTTDANGNRILAGKTQEVDHQVQTLIKKDPGSFVVYDEKNQRVEATITDEKGNRIPNPDFPQGQYLNLVSTNNQFINDYTAGEKMGTKASFNVVSKVPEVTAIQDPANPDKMMHSTTYKEKRYKFVANGMTTKSFTDAQSKKFYSNYLADPGYNPQDPDNTSNITPTGVISYIRAREYEDPDNTKYLQHVGGLKKPGEKIETPYTMYNPLTQQQEVFNVETTKTADGKLISKLYDDQGNQVVKETKTDDIIDFDKWLRSMKNLSEKIVKDNQAAGKGPDEEALRKKYSKTSSSL